MENQLKETLQVELDQKRAELNDIKEKIKRAESSKQRSQQRHVSTALFTASALVRSNTKTEDPIWVEGLHYPAQYLVRQTRSMSTHSRQTKSIFPSICTPSAPITDFQLPDSLFHDLKAGKLAIPIIRAFKVLEEGERELTLKSSLLFKEAKDSPTTFLYSCHGEQSVIGVVGQHSVTVVNVGDDKLTRLWTETLKQGSCLKCTKMVHSGSRWLIVAVIDADSSTNQIVRVYVAGDNVALTLPDHSDRSALSEASDLCVWSKDSNCICIATLTHNGAVMMWKLELDLYNKWSASLVTARMPNLPHGSTSLIHVQETDCTLVWAVMDAIIVWDAFAGRIKHQYPLICGSNHVSHTNIPSTIWARQEKGILFLVLCVGSAVGESAFLLTAHDNQLRQVHAFLPGLPCHQMKCTPEDYLQVVTDTCELLMWDVTQAQLHHRICISDCELLACEWSNTKQSLIVLSATGHLCLFTDHTHVNMP